MTDKDYNQMIYTVHFAREKRSLSARRERLICCGAVEQFYDHLPTYAQRVLCCSQWAADQGRITRHPECGLRVWDRLSRRGVKIRDLATAYEGASGDVVLHNCQHDLDPRSRDYRLSHLLWDLAAATYPWYGRRYNGLRGGISGLLHGPDAGNPYLEAVVGDVLPAARPQRDWHPPTIWQWRGGAILHLADDIYGRKRWEDLPILADMIEEASDEAYLDILQHLRSPGLHVRGCWVLDWLLGKE